MSQDTVSRDQSDQFQNIFIKFDYPNFVLSNYKLRYQSERIMIPSVKSYNKDFCMEEYVESIAITRYLVTFFEIIEEKIRICHRENQVFHVSTQMVQVICVFNIPEIMKSL